ncbi:MAG: hypothetical protein LBC95_02540 [Candidatus Nomurabacteria bacterium]|nr:hypothetical protein [Candidatus Nomurabacteria bacterium]
MENVNLEKGPHYNKFGIEVTQNVDYWREISERYGVRSSEVAMIDFNRSGLCLPNNEVRQDFRVRFRGKFFDGNQSWYALPVRGAEDTNFSAVFGELYFGNDVIGTTDELMLDTCEASYQRGPNLLNLNSRSRSNCGGCQACVHNYKNLYDETVIKDDLSLKTLGDVQDFFDSRKLDVSGLKQIAVVTGLFSGEENVVEHMKIVNCAAKKRGFTGELMYFGCEVNSEKALDELAQIDNFALVYALDNFTKRESLLVKTKSLISVEDIKRTLDVAKSKGIQTTVSYIAGIDQVFEIGNGFMELKDSLTRFPVVNIYQIQTPGQAKIIAENARGLEYYIQSRVLLENIFADKNMRPRRWENYRPLWYDYYSDEKLPSNSYGERE